MNSLPPWALGPFELLIHAEEHLQSGEDFDRRIALVSFDNAIEVAITTYLTLNPIHREGRTYKKEDIDGWLKHYHSKLDFLETEIEKRKISWKVEKTHIIWAHDHRNEQYHGGTKGTPEITVIRIARCAALWIFSILYDVEDVETVLGAAVMERTGKHTYSREKTFDIAIDAVYGILEVAEQSYYTSEVLFAVDYVAYRDLGGQLCASSDSSQSESESETV